MSWLQILWLVLLVGFLVVEGTTMSLVSIWFACGSLGALIVASIAPDASELAPQWIAGEILAFLFISGAAVLGLRPFATRWLKVKRVGTNADRNIGQTALVTETIDNDAPSGAVYLQGKTWTARSAEPRVTFAEGEHVRVLSIEGVKLMVEAAELSGAGRLPVQKS